MSCATIPDVAGQLVIDEAYADYAGVDALDRLDDGVIILRTFSKAFGLAGARVGYALATPELRRGDLLSPGAAVGVLALGGARVDAVAQSARRLVDRSPSASDWRVSSRHSGSTPVRSFTNFLFIPMDEPEKLVEQLLPYGAVTRAYPGGLRISVRDEIDNDFLLDALRGVLFDTPMPASVPPPRAQHRGDAAECSSARAR